MEDVIIDSACSSSTMLAQLGDFGLENGPRVGQDRRTTASSEAYVIRRYLLNKAIRLSYPVSVYHADKPDIYIEENGEKFGVEITEVCPPEEGKAMAKMTDKSCVRVGNYSDTGSKAAIIDAVEQIQHAIDRKSTKPYTIGKSVSLLLYPNSDALLWVSLFKLEKNIAGHQFRLGNLSSVEILWRDADVLQLSN